MREDYIEIYGLLLKIDVEAALQLLKLLHTDLPDLYKDTWIICFYVNEATGAKFKPLWIKFVALWNKNSKWKPLGTLQIESRFPNYPIINRSKP